MFDEAAGEVTIGGIYLRLFIQQPAWVGFFKTKKTSFYQLMFSYRLGKATQRFSQSQTQLANHKLR